MLLRLPVIVSALAFVLACIAAPHEHLHRDTGLQHAHVTSHQHGHHHGELPDEPDHDDQDAGTVLSVGTFIASGPVSVVTAGHADGPALPLLAPDTGAAESTSVPEPRTHGPPVGSTLPSRGPPALPAF